MPKILQDVAEIYYGKSQNGVADKYGSFPIIGTGGFLGRAKVPLFSGPAVVVGRKGTLDNPTYIAEDFWAVDTTYAVIPKENTHAKWLYFTLRNSRLELLNEATGVPSINRDRLFKVLVQDIEFSEQTRIAYVLDIIDEAIAKTEAVITKLKQVRAGMLHDLLSYGLDEHGQLRDPIAHPEQFKDSPLGRIPKNWEMESLGFRLKDNDGCIQTGPFGSQLHANEYTTEGIPVVMPQNIKDGEFDKSSIAQIPHYRAEELHRHRMVPGDLIFARRGDLSRCAVVGLEQSGWLCGTGCLLMRFRQKTLNSSWLSPTYRYEVCQRQIACRAVGTTMFNLNTKILEDLLLPFPAVAEQEAIIAYLKQHDILLYNEIQTLGKFESIKRGLQDDLLTGRVRVPESIMEGAAAV